jgi:hypothetical protein
MLQLFLNALRVLITQALCQPVPNVSKPMDGMCLSTGRLTARLEVLRDTLGGRGWPIVGTA